MGFLLVVVLLMAGLVAGQQRRNTNSNFDINLPDTGPSGDRIPLNCIRCTFVRDNRFIRTDGTGQIDLSFDCASSLAALQFCSDPTVVSFPTLVPDIDDICKSRQPPRICDADSYDPVTVWSDGRLDPGYTIRSSRFGRDLTRWQQGDFRDVTPSVYRMMGYRSSYTPFSIPTPNIQMGRPDIYSVFRGGPMRTMMGFRQRDFPGDASVGAVGGFANQTILNVTAPGNYTATTAAPTTTPGSSPLVSAGPVDHVNVSGLPLGSVQDDPDSYFAHNNRKMLFYAGFEDLDALETLSSCTEVNPLDTTGFYSQCGGHKLVSYLTSHRNIEFLPLNRSNFENFRSDSQMLFYTNRTRAIIAQRFRSQRSDPCSDDQCLNNVTSRNGLVITRTRPPLLTFSVNVSPGSTLRSEEPGIFVTEMYFVTGFDGPQLKFPLITFSFRPPGGLDQCSYVNWVEESVDGANWQVHPETVHPDAIKFYQARDWEYIRDHLSTDVLYGAVQSGQQLVHKLFTTTGSNVHLRLVFARLYGRFGSRPYSPALDQCGVMWVPQVIVHSQGRGATTLHLVESLGNIPGLMNLTGLPAGCERTPLCIYHKSPFDTYPIDGQTALNLYGSQGIRDFFTNQVIPAVYDDCTRIIRNPVSEFLTNPQLEENVCRRMGDDITRVTCFEYTPNSHRGGTIVNTNSLNTQVSYVAAGVTLTVSTQRRDIPYPTPQFVLGNPYTVDNRTNALWVYSQPVEGGVKIGDVYTIDRESCTALNSTDPRVNNTLPENPNCTCIPFPVSPIACICQGFKAFKYTAGLPQGVTFRYPQFFTPLKFPSNFTLRASRLMYDTGIFTTLDLDCPTYLCSNNEDCLDQLAQSNYGVFCQNQRAIVQSVLTALKRTTRDIDFATSQYLMANAIPPNMDVRQAPPLRFSGLTPQQVGASPRFDEFTGPLGDYYNTAINTRFNRTISVHREFGFNYRDPQTNIGEAIGLSLFPQLGVGFLTEKVNDLAGQLTAEDQFVRDLADFSNYLGARMKDLASQVSDGFREVNSALEQLASEHNSLIQDLNDRSRIQADFNREVADKVNVLADAVRSAISNLDFLDLVGARAGTMGVQAAAIMTRALEYDLRGREFAERVRRCTSPATANAVDCAGTAEGYLISSMYKKQGTLHMIEALVMEPTKFIYAYGAPEFCIGQSHYTVRSPQNTFVIINATVFVSPKVRFAPQSLTDSNTLVLDFCGNPDLVIQDFTPGVNVVDLNGTTLNPFPSLNFTNFNISEIEDRFDFLFNDTVNIDKQIAAINRTIAGLDNFNVTQFREQIQNDINRLNSSVSVGEIVLAVVVSLLIGAIIGIIVYLCCCGPGKKGYFMV